MSTVPRICSSVLLTLFPIAPALADANSWLKPSSGNWEEPQWSQGILPNSGHSVMITNAGWKAVQISNSTAQNFPGSLTVYSVTVSSPADSFNTLLLNYAGFGRPLTANYNMHIGPGAALTMFSSALRLAGPTGVGLSVGGEVNQNDSSQVIGNQADIGWVGHGTYNLNSGLVQLQHLWLGGPHGGVFNQNGGSNSPGILHLETNGIYNLRDGDFNGTTYTADGSLIRQDGGRVHSLLEFHKGHYVLNGGVNYGGVRLSVEANYRRGSATAVQNGGTNLGPIYLGSERGGGTYTLSNGVVQAPVIALDMFGSFRHYAGTVSTPGAITLSFGYYDRAAAAGSSYLLNAGSLSCTGMDIDLSSFVQGGGTNQIAGDLGLRGGWYGSTGYTLNGGLLVNNNTTLGYADRGGFFQNGGTHRIANRLLITAGFNYSSFQDYQMSYRLSGGNLVVSNISITSRGIFNQSGGTVIQSGTLNVDNARVFIGPGTQTFGALQLSAGTNDLTMPSALTVLRFRNSSSLAWSSTSMLIINNWSGSYAGGGSQCIIFGNSSAALTPQQVAKIFFNNPVGHTFGLHPAKILPSGEIVPDTTPPTGRTPPRLALRKLPNSTVEITVTVEPGYDYGVLTSTDLGTWNLWTNRVVTNNTFTVVDPNQVQWWPYRRFYKAVFMR